MTVEAALFRDHPRIPNDPFGSNEWGPSPNDERHHITISGILEQPKGFQLAPIMQYGSARAYAVTNSSNTLNTGRCGIAVVVPKNDPTNWLAFAGNNAGAQNCFYGLNGVARRLRSAPRRSLFRTGSSSGQELPVRRAHEPAAHSHGPLT